MVHTALAVACGVVALAFGLSTFDRWLSRRRPHDLAWTAALTMFVLASGFLAAGAAGGWNGPTFRGFYLFGAILNVPVLALGTVYLHAGERWGRRAAIGTAMLAAFATGVLMVAPFTHALPRDELAQGSDVFGALPRILAALGSGLGATVIVVGSVWSAIRSRTVRVVVANALIAAGTVIAGASGLLNSLFDEMTGFAVTLLIGIAAIFAGYLVATTGGTTSSPRLGGEAQP